MKCVASRMKVICIQPLIAPLFGRAFLHVDDTASIESFFQCRGHLQRPKKGIPCNSLGGAVPRTHYVIQSLPLCGGKVLHARHMI